MKMPSPPKGQKGQATRLHIASSTQELGLVVLPHLPHRPRLALLWITLPTLSSSLSFSKIPTKTTPFKVYGFLKL